MRLRSFTLKNSKFLSIFGLFMYLALLCYVSYYHEPWHDEGQAWLIARDNSLWQLFTVTTHYEGHPPLWFLLLMPFAKSGFPFELGIKAINIFFCTLATSLVLFKSPLPWYLRLSIPFSYFYFYQFGIINRSYSVLLAATMAAAYYYPYRITKPYKLALSLGIMSATMAYGMMLACGIAISWLLSMIFTLRQAKQPLLTSIWKQTGTKALFLLFWVAVINAYLIIPRPDAAFFGKINTGLSVSAFIYSLVVVPGQVICTNDVKDFFKDDLITLFQQNMSNYVRGVKEAGVFGLLLLISYLLSYSYGLFFILFLGCLSCITKMKSLFFLPLFLYVLLATHVFWNNYHAGILAGFFVFFVWQLYAEQENITKIKTFFQRQCTFSWEFRILRIFYYVVVTFIMGINIYWSWSASVLEINNQFDVSRSIAYYIKSHNLESKALWIPPTEEPGKKYVTIGTYALNAYFNKNMIENLDGGKVNRSYHEYKLLPQEQTYKRLQALRKPDLILARNEQEVELLRSILNDNADFELLQTFPSGRIWKDTIMTTTVNLYGRREKP